MSEANKLLLRRWFEQVWNQKSEAAIDQMFGTDGKSHGFPDADSLLVGPEAFKAVHRVFCGAFPDLHVEVEDVVAEGDRVAVRWRVTMTHLGDHLARISHRHRFSAGIDGSVALLPFLWAVGWWSAIISGVRGAVWG
jgi:predicted ester cyclase